ncbi:hypothetical protein XENORESO_011170 [Xenotaenia resolanae]|uniref:Uncharacterized protein n=1 Tax=Xenotaenia resolanae TaxID=208358 RepID=A0ABV0VWB4_9TELE
MDPETQDPGTYHSPSRGPTEPNGPGPGKQPPGVSQHTPKLPAPDTENHKYPSGQRHQPPAGSVAGRKYWSRRGNSPRPNLTQKQAHTVTITHRNRHKTCSPAPPTRLPTGARQGARATEGSIGGRPPQQAKERAPRQPHTQTPEVPQDAGHSPSHTEQ